MKICKTDSFVLERMQLQPITNAELKKAQDDYEHSLIRTGSDIKDYDLVLIVATHNNEVKNISYYCYRNTDWTYRYPQGYLKDLGSEFDYAKFIDKLELTYNDYAYYIVKIYRPYKGKENTLQPNSYFLSLLGEVEKSKNYYCVYENKKLLDKFKDKYKEFTDLNKK